MLRLLLLVHRYLGIAVGLIVALWCLSAFVMMYVRFPELTRGEALASLPEIDRRDCCAGTPRLLAALMDSDEFVVESLAGRPIVRIRTVDGDRRTFDLQHGKEIAAVDEALAARIAASYFRQRGIGESATPIGAVERDQWTVAGYFDELRPFFLFEAGDAAGSRIYVSAVNGRTTQDSMRAERFWNWLGAVVHWIYPTILRQHTGAWTQVVIWASVVSLFLVVIGIYIGVVQFRRCPSGHRSPYRGMSLWHHYTGLVFGALTLTWLLSGLFSVNPWGLFLADSGSRERQRIERLSLADYDYRRFLQSLSGNALPPDTVRVRSAPFAGEFAVLAVATDGTSTRLDGWTLAPRPLSEDQWRGLPATLGVEAEVLDAGWLTESDAYYFVHRDAVEFPVYRLRLDDDAGTRYYFHATSGKLVSKVDAGARGFRWWFHALHRGDFADLSQRRPLWDVIMLTLLSGVTIGALTGVYLAYRRLSR